MKSHVKPFTKGIKYVLRGIFFAVYFPFYLLIRLLSAALDHVISPSIEWLYKKALIPLVLAFIKYLVVPVVRVIADPLEWLWKHACKPALKFLWKYMLYPVMYYGIYQPLRLLWLYGFRWLWREILVPVMRFGGIVVAWLFHLFAWLFRHIMYYPLRWVWRHAVHPAVRWMRREIIQPLVQWFRNRFR